MNLISFIKKKISKKNRKKEENKLKVLDEMCKRSIASGVCPHACDICAWNILRYVGGEDRC